MCHLLLWLSLAVVTACGVRTQSGASVDLTGRWEFQGATNRLGVVIPAWMRLTFFIVGANRDSLFGGATVYLDVKEPPDNRPCGIVRGTGAETGKVELVIFTIDDPNADMIIDARVVRNDSMIVESMKPRNGKNVVAEGTRLIFRRTSKDARTGCLR